MSMKEHELIKDLQRIAFTEYKDEDSGINHQVFARALLYLITRIRLA